MANSELSRLIANIEAEIPHVEWQERQATKTAHEARIRRGALVEELEELRKLEKTQ